MSTKTVTISLETAKLIRSAFLPSNPNKLRVAAPEVVGAAHEFIRLTTLANLAVADPLPQSVEATQGEARLTPEQIREDHARQAAANIGRPGLPQGACQCEVCSPESSSSSASDWATELRDRYTFCQPVCVDETPDAHTVWIKVENQSFCIDGYQDTKEEAEWMRLMLGKALASIIRAAASGPAEKWDEKKLKAEFVKRFGPMEIHTGYGRDIELHAIEQEEKLEVFKAGASLPATKPKKCKH